MDLEQELKSLRTLVERQVAELSAANQRIGLLEDKNEIERLQYAYGYLLDNRMFRELADLFADEGAWFEIAGRGRYCGKETIHDFLLQVLGGGRWGLIENEVINHVQQQVLITVEEGRTRAQARARAQVQGNSPPDTPTFLLADAVYENDYVKEGGRWKIQGARITMTFYVALERARIWFAAASPSEVLPPDQPSEPAVEGLGRPFNPFRWPHPVTGAPLPIPVSDPSGPLQDRGGGGYEKLLGTTKG